MIEVPLREDFSVCIDDYLDLKGTVFLANPNAPTGLALSSAEIERMLQARAERWYTASDKDTGKECRESCWKS